MEIEKLKVAELRSELTNRGLDPKGTKPILVVRLKEAIQSEENKGSTTTVKTEVKKPQDSAKTDGDEDEEDMEEEEEEEEEKPQEAGNKEEAPDTKQGVKEETKAESVNKSSDAKNEDKKEVTPRSNRQQRRGVKRKMNEDEPFVIQEDEPVIPENICLLDWYNSDLNLLIEKASFLKAEPLFKDGWGYVWAGVKATHGFNQGKIGFQVKLIDNMDSKLEDEKDLHELRLGFSTNEPSMQLGESKNSFSYGGSGKKGTDCTFEDYGEKFAKGDVIGAYLDFTSDDVKITFTKNETTLDEAFSFPKSQLDGKALFPHISTRNVKFEVNFGKTMDDIKKEPWFPLLAEYEFPSNATDSERGPARIATREECEMIMMIGLPASGKSKWVSEYVEEHPDKRYYVIGTTSLIDKMKVDGVCRRTSHTGRRDVLIQKCTRCLQDWLRLASQRRRNIIIDQTNVYPNAQKRKVRPFEGMIRKAVVMVPSDEEYKVRAEAQEKAESKDVPDSAVMEMKANFSLPVEGGTKVTTKNASGEEETKEIVSPFKEIIFASLQREEAQKLIEEYNKDAKEKGFGKKVENKAKRARGNSFRRGRSMMRNRRGGRNFGPRGGSGFRGGPSNGRMFMRGNNFRRGGGGPHAPPPPPMRGFMPPRGPMQYNRGNRNQVKFGKNGRSNWGGQDSAPWSQWQQPNRPTGWGHWNQGNQGSQNHHQQSWGSQGNNRNHQSLNHQGFSSGNGGGNHGGGGGGGHWNSNSSGGGGGSGWNNSNSNPSSGWNNSNPSSGWNNSNSSSGWNQGGNSKWSNNSNQGYPGNSYWGGGGGYGGR